ncbi:bifunctional 2-C-methyl-D-erythritol 4-phosphate cytidylyltransferase/2-C-methyl-D-erythritol 2,4-cyclodiphosphate synthase [Magnetovibrio sp. PR-2]|uniref:bifunctional 2-C-methyl-D-erythritol 4-phosphate cytidylyltransferase/2-C-methyl-D-erythritol 2,4-cyclodiphosphate synthase n=1 Tax=Magnetovibrio sp. PR-2 TaxID=3120356 RepID=UPI002FCE4E2E
MTKTVALVVAAGRGRRFGGTNPKQYAPLGDSVVLRHTVSALLKLDTVDAVRCVIHPDDQDLYATTTEGLALLPPVFGGETRQDSVRLGLQSLEGEGIDFVLIHDAARPFVDETLVLGVLDALNTHPGAIPALPVTDTLKRGQDGVITDTTARDGLYRAQTPQGFHYGDILKAHREFQGQELTDDAQLFEKSGLTVALSPGAEHNFKITTPEDMMRAERQLSQSVEYRTASGYDVHRFEDGDFVTLCGVKIPHTQRLSGHSDADVALHALTDALLGCIGAGDIGQHFPPSDPQWKGAASDQFAQHAVKLIAERGGQIVNVDVTILCEAPKIGPNRAAMVTNMAKILGISEDRVSVKATTTEGLGFTGRREGIAAQAQATIRLMN